MPVALVEKGTTPEQRVHCATLETMAALLERESVASPSLFIVGHVVSLADKLAWYDQ